MLSFGFICNDFRDEVNITVKGSITTLDLVVGFDIKKYLKPLGLMYQLSGIRIRMLC